MFQVNGYSLLGASHYHAVRVLKAAGDDIIAVVSRPQNSRRNCDPKPTLADTRNITQPPSPSDMVAPTNVPLQTPSFVDEQQEDVVKDDDSRQVHKTLPEVRLSQVTSTPEEQEVVEVTRHSRSPPLSCDSVPQEQSPNQVNNIQIVLTIIIIIHMSFFCADKETDL